MKMKVFLFVGEENGILIKHYLKYQFSTFEYFLKIPKSPLKIGTFQNQKRGGENGMVYPGGENGFSQLL